MKNLYKHVIVVKNDLERKIALDFYRRAAKKPLWRSPYLSGKYVGLSTSGFVCSNHIKYHYEVEVQFDEMNILADSPSRKQALARAFKANGVKYNDSRKPVETKKVPSKMLPVVTFWYPSSATHQNVERRVRVVKADNMHIIGFDINKNEKFKKFKRTKVSGLINLVAFNS